MDTKFVKFDAAKAGREFAQDESRQQLNTVLSLYLHKMISTQGPMALDAYLVTVISPLIDSIPLGQENFFLDLQRRVGEFLEIILDEERNMRKLATATEGAGNDLAN
jgi:hypothetical protein